MREIEASPRGLVYPPFPPSDKAGWERIRKVADFFQPYRETSGAGISKDKPIDLVGYRYPIIATYSGTDAAEVYSLVKAVDESMDLIRNLTGSAANWDPKVSGKPPADAPWHDGAIRYLKEKGIWTAEHQAWQDQRMARLKKVQAGWADARKKFGSKGDEAWPKFWEEYRVKTLGLAPSEA